MTMMDHKNEIQNGIVVNVVVNVYFIASKDKKQSNHIETNFSHSKIKPKRNVMELRQVIKFKSNVNKQKMSC